MWHIIQFLQWVQEEADHFVVDGVEAAGEISVVMVEVEVEAEVEVEVEM